MCKPIPGNFVRARRECEVKPRKGSTQILLKRKTIVLGTEARGMVHDTPAKDDDHRIILFEFDAEGMMGATLVAELHCDDIKGIEA